MKLSFNDKITQADFPKAGEAFSPRFVKNFADMVRQVSQWSQKGVTLVDNMNGAKLTLNMAHGVPQLVSKPLPSGANPIGVRAINCDTQAIPALTMSQTATVNGVVVNAGQGSVWLTALYPLAEQAVLLTSTTAQSIPSTAETVYSNFPATPTVSIGKNITYDGSSKLTTKIKGNFDIRASTPFGANVTGMRLIAILVNSTVRWGTQAYGNAGSSGSYVACSTIVPLNVGDAVQFELFQDSGGAVSTSPSTGFLCTLAMRQLSNDASLTANVTLFIEGA